MASECDICMDDFNASTRKRVSCPNSECTQKFCKKCVQDHLLSTKKKAHCPCCKVGYTISFMEENLNKTWVEKEYRMKEAGDFLEQEKSQIPATLAIVLENKRIKRINQCINIYWNYIGRTDTLHHWLKKTKHEPGVVVKTEELIEAFIEERNEKCTKWLLEIGVRFCKIGTYGNALEEPEDPLNYGRDKGGCPATWKYGATNNKRVTIIHIPCPTDNCRGFLDSTYECCMCNIKYCRRCLEPKDSNKKKVVVKSSKKKETPDGPVEEKTRLQHVCDPNKAANIEEVNRSTRRCPKCGVPIHQYEGCDQAFCVQCHTPFSYKTGKIETGRIHNPHYYEMLRQGGNIRREAGDIPCGGPPMYPYYFEQKGFLDLIPLKNRLLINSLTRTINHISGPEIRSRTRDNFRDNQKLRMKYIEKEITEDEWKRRLKIISKREERDREVRQVLTAFVQCATELSRQFNASIKNAHRIHWTNVERIKNLEEVIVNFVALQESVIRYSEIYNRALAILSYRYKHATPFLAPKDETSKNIDIDVYPLTIKNKKQLEYICSCEGFPSYAKLRELGQTIKKAKPKTKPKAKTKACSKI